MQHPRFSLGAAVGGGLSETIGGPTARFPMSERHILLVSACLLGTPCRYDGTGKPCAALERLRAAGYVLVPVCPEKLGGLPTPRPPAELQPDGRVVNRQGKDVTAAYQLGAERALDTARREGCALAVLKERSPSCGCGQVYDGSFSGRLVPGSGVTARLLQENKIPVLGETQAELLLLPSEP